MNPNLLRGALYTVGFSLPIWALGVAFFSLGAAVVMAIIGAVLVIVAGFFERVEDQ